MQLFLDKINLEQLVSRIINFLKYVLIHLPREFKNGFVEKRLILKAGALSYTTVLCVLPLLAITFSVANIALTRLGPDQTNKLVDNFMSRMVPQVKLLREDNQSRLQNKVDEELEILPSKSEIRNHFKNFIKSVGSGQVGLIGTFFLLFLAVSLVLTMEHTFNDIWGVTVSRGILARISMYFSVIIFGLIFLSTAITLTGRWQSTVVARSLQKIPYLTRLFNFLTPFVLFWFILSFIYITLPSTRVKFIPAIAGGILAGTLLQMNNLLNSLYVVNLVMASKIYGGLGILPIFLFGLYVSWLIVLAGAEFSYSLEKITEESYSSYSQ